jgi:membrane associated rhomboid family serine protease
MDEQAADANSPVSARPPFHLWHLPEGAVPWITLGAIALSVIATLLYHTARDVGSLVFYSGGHEIWLDWKNWRALFGTGFLHSGILHLLFNCYWLWIFGRVLEGRLGARRYGLLIIMTLWASSIGELVSSGNPGIGMSGVVYGLFGFLSVRRKKDAAFPPVLTRGVVTLFWVWLVLCIPLSSGDIVRIANGGHVGGLIAGVLFGFATGSERWLSCARVGGLAAAALSFVPLFWAPWQDGWLAAKVYRAMEQREYDVALQWSSRIKAGRYDEWARRNEASIHVYQASLVSHRAELLQLAEKSRDPNVLNTIAWRLATSPHDHLRDGAKAVTIASRACEADGWKTAAYLDTLAAAHAESGNFDEAAKWMQRALVQPGEHRAELEKHLAAFQLRRSWREEEPAVAKAK